MSKWITDRTPTKDDCDKATELVWMSGKHGAYLNYWHIVEKGEPWMPVTAPDPYVKPKTWIAERYNNEPYWRIRDTRTGELCNLVTKKEETMRKLEAFLNEVMP